MARVEAVLDRRWLTNDGPFVREFEEHICRFVGVKHCIAMCNATIALEITIRALQMTGEVIVPSFTFVATAHALQWQEITPVFCDVDPRTHNLDPECVERLITPRTSGIIGVHLWGYPCDVERLERIARRRELRLIFDAAHAFGCSHGGRMIGGFGQAEVFSFHATKFVNCGEGGAVVTNDDGLAEKLRLMRNFGFAGYDNVRHLGTNGKMSEFAAAMGLTSLESLDAFVASNKANYDEYCIQLHSIPGLRVLESNSIERRNYQYVVVEVDPAQAGLTRDEMLRVLHAENVLARRYFYPGCHRMEPYRTRSPQAGSTLPETERLCERVFQLPTGTAVSREDIRTIGQLLRALVRDPHSSRRRFEASRSLDAAEETDP